MQPKYHSYGTDWICNLEPQVGALAARRISQEVRRLAHLTSPFTTQEVSVYKVLGKKTGSMMKQGAWILIPCERPQLKWIRCSYI